MAHHIIHIQNFYNKVFFVTNVHITLLSATETSLVGMWPLNAEYEGANLVPGMTNITFNVAEYPLDAPVPDGGAWTSPPLYFPSMGKFGSFDNVSDVIPHSGSYSLIAALYQPTTTYATNLFLWNTPGANDVRVGIMLIVQTTFTAKVMNGSLNTYSHNAILNYNQWYTLALSYDQATHNLTLYVDGDAQSFQGVPDLASFELQLSPDALDGGVNR